MTKQTENDTPPGRDRPVLGTARDDARRLRFRSQDDALNFARHSAENARRWAQANPFDLAKRYEHLQSHIVLRLVDRIGTDDAEYHLVIFGIPPGWEPHLHDQTRAMEAFYERVTDTHSDRDENPVLGPIRELVHAPNQWIASLVRIERPKERDNIIMQIPAPSPTDDIGIKLGICVCDREVGAFETGVAEHGSGSEASLIQSGPEPFCYFNRLIEESIGERLGKADLVNFISRIRISFNETSVWLGIEKSLNTRFKVVGMLVCSGDASFGVTEWIDSHE